MQENSQETRILLTAGTLALDPVRQSVTLSGRRVTLGGRAWNLLYQLMQHPQQLQSKTSLITTVWEGRPVSEGVLTTAMKQLRKAISDPTRKPVYIETVHKKGYRFLLPVEIKQIAFDDQSDEPTGGLVALSRDTRTLQIVSLVCAVVAVLLIGYFLGGWWQVSDQAADGQNQAVVSEFAPDAKSIAVLPFVDLSPEGNQSYFSDGVSEELLNVFAGVDGLKVASRTSAFAFKSDEQADIPSIARQLNVRYVLEGSVRKAGDSIRVTAQLIDGLSDVHMWSKTYDRDFDVENVFDIQDDISSIILSELLGRLDSEGNARMASVTADTDNIDAYDLYLKANALFIARGNDNIRQSVQLFEQVVEIDPTFARAWAGLAAAAATAPSWGVSDRDYLQIAEDAANHSITLDPEQALPYAVLGNIQNNQLRPDFEKALRVLGEAIKRNPNNPSAYMWRGVTLRLLGYFERALADFEACLAVDPAYRNCRSHAEVTYMAMGNVEKARELWVANSELGARGISHPLLNYFAKNGNHPIVLAMLQNQTRNQFVEEWMVEPIFQAWTDPEYDREAGYEQVYTRMQELGFDPLKNPGTAWFIWIAFGNYEDAQPVGSRFYWGTTIDEFKSSPHRKRLLNEIGMPEYWRRHGFPEHCRAVGDDDFECL